MTNSVEPMGVEFCKGDVALGSGCLRCGRCAVQLAGKWREAQRLGDHWKSNHDNLAARLRVFTQRPDIPANLAERLPWYRELVALQGEVARLKAVASVPEFHPVAARKLESLQERGYKVTGYAIEKPVEGAPPSRGFIDAGGFVGWWRGDDEWNKSVEREVERKAQMLTLVREDAPQVAPACPVCHGEGCEPDPDPKRRSVSDEWRQKAMRRCTKCGGSGTTAARIVDQRKPPYGVNGAQAAGEGEIAVYLPNAKALDGTGIKFSAYHPASVPFPGTGVQRVDRAECPECKGRSGYFVSDTTISASAAKYLACSICDAGAAQTDQRQNGQQNIPEIIPAPLSGFKGRGPTHVMGVDRPEQSRLMQAAFKADDLVEVPRAPMLAKVWPGHKVMLASGGPVMTVMEFTDGVATCWWGSDPHIEKSEFPIEMLRDASFADSTGGADKGEGK